MPDLSSCEPLRCRNVALSTENRQALTDQLHKLDAHLANADLLPPYVAQRVTAQRHDLAALLDPATGTTDRQ